MDLDTRGGSGQVSLGFLMGEWCGMFGHNVRFSSLWLCDLGSGLSRQHSALEFWFWFFSMYVSSSRTFRHDYMQANSYKYIEGSLGS